jgi:hypothetical protein
MLFLFKIIGLRELWIKRENLATLAADDVGLVLHTALLYVYTVF